MGGGRRKGPEKLLCVLPFPEPKDILDRIRENYPKIEVSYFNLKQGSDAFNPLKDAPQEIYKDITILCTLSAVPSSPSNAPNLDLVHVFSAGIDHLSTRPIYADTDITFTTSSGVHGPQIAEWVIMTALVQSHGYNLLHDLQKQKKWGSKDANMHLHHVRDLVGQRLGVLGYGSIGRQVARVAKAMGMDVIAYTATPKETPDSKKDRGFIVPGTGDPEGEIPSAWYSGLDKESLHRFLKQDIDLLLISVPLTKETTHLLSTTEFALLRPNRTFLANISRGAIVDQDALITALQNNTLRGAALDVTHPEPLPQDSPLWEMDNVVITPHISGIGVNYTDRAFQILDINLGRRERGETLINVVDRRRGYGRN